MTTKTNNQTDQTDRPSTSRAPHTAAAQVPGEQTNLSYLYGTIGIQAVAAAARYSNVRKKPAVHRIDQRFVESAV